MSMLTSQVDRLRTAADQFDKVLCGKFDAIEPSTISPMMREAADTIENLSNRLKDIENLSNRLKEQMCELEINTDMTAIKCSKCGYVVPKGTNLTSVRYCAGCGRRVVG